MAHPDTLTVGADYFLVHYFDEELLVPCIMTLRYEGPETADDGRRLWLFRQLGDAGDSSDSDPEPRIGLEDSQLWEVLNLDDLLAVLNELRSIRPPTAPLGAALRPDEVLQKHPLRSQVSEFLSTPSRVKLDITIRFRDKALFLKKVAGIIELHVFTHPLREEPEDKRLAAVMRARKVPSTTDYLADNGRTRVLHYKLQADSDFVADTCAAILATAYEMSARDELLIEG